MSKKAPTQLPNALPPLTAGRFARMSQLATQPAVTPEQAAANKRAGRYPQRARPARPGIVPAVSMTIYRWVRDGKFPPPNEHGLFDLTEVAEAMSRKRGAQ